MLNGRAEIWRLHHDTEVNVCWILACNTFKAKQSCKTAKTIDRSSDEFQGAPVKKKSKPFNFKDKSFFQMEKLKIFAAEKVQLKRKTRDASLNRCSRTFIICKNFAYCNLSSTHLDFAFEGKNIPFQDSLPKQTTHNNHCY